jgi:formylglycine-generating enzyme required for sulfatase activity
VEKVTWHDAIEFCKKLSKAVGQTIDLPSEMMWEWAARGATKSKGYTYAGSNNLNEVGWYDEDLDSGSTHPVGQKRANELGIYDMSGNVWEWCMDNWTKNVNQLPQDGSPLTNGGDSTRRVVRGGSWYDPPDYCRCALRYRDNPDGMYSFHGFRVSMLPVIA